MTRDNFTPAVIRKLRDRVNSLCSNPDCRATTLAPSGYDSVNNIGVAAHITAASIGGARYDEKMSQSERKSIKNAIWLCSNCSIKIDRDPDLYPITLLHKWKNISEEKARAQQGKKLPNENDAIDTLTQALSGFPKRFICSSIDSAHRAADSSLQLLDARFNVVSQYVNGVSEFHVSAKCPVKLKVTGSDEYWKGINDLVNYGLDFSVSAQAISIEGSKLFDRLFSDSDDGILTVSSKKVESVLKIWLIQDNTKIIEAFDDIRGNISVGAKRYQFKGEACGELFSVTASGPTIKDGGESSISISLTYEKWDGKNIANLPYFEKIFSFYEKLDNGWALCSRLEIDGTPVWSSKGVGLKGNAHCLDILNFLYYTRRCLAIAKKFNIDILFESDISYTSDQHQRIIEISQGITGIVTTPIKTSTTITNVEALKDVSLKKAPILIRLVEPTDETIHLFKTPCLIYEKITHIESVIPRLTKPIEKIQVDDEIELTFIPDGKCSINIEFNVKNKFS